MSHMYFKIERLNLHTKLSLVFVLVGQNHAAGCTFLWDSPVDGLG